MAEQSLSKMKVAELRALAESLGVTLDANETKADLTVKIAMAREAKRDLEQDGRGGTQPADGEHGSHGADAGSATAEPAAAPAPARPRVRVLVPELNFDYTSKIAVRLRSLLKGVQVSVEPQHGSKDNLIWIETDDPREAMLTAESVVSNAGHTRYSVKVDHGG